MQIIQNLQEGNYTKHLKSKVVSFNPSVQVKTKRQKKKKKGTGKERGFQHRNQN